MGARVRCGCCGWWSRGWWVLPVALHTLMAILAASSDKIVKLFAPQSALRMGATVGATNCAACPEKVVGQDQLQGGGRRGMGVTLDKRM